MRILYPDQIGILEMLVFVEGGKPENPDGNPRSKARSNNKLNPHMSPGRNQARATLVEGDRSHHCAILAPRSEQLPPHFSSFQSSINARKTKTLTEAQKVKAIGWFDDFRRTFPRIQRSCQTVTSDKF